MNFTNEEIQVAIARLGLNIEAERANPSSALRFLLARASDHKDIALTELAIVNPTDTAAIMDAQIRVQAANLIGRWIKETIENGIAAAEEIERAYVDDEIEPPQAYID